MKRSIRISLLVFTISAAILAFGALWYTRPSSPSYIIDEARQRQTVPLLEVQEPSTRLPLPEINYDKLAATVSPKVIDSLVGNKEFMTTLVAASRSEISKTVQDYTNSTLVPSMNEKISTLVKELATTLNTTLKDDLTAMVDSKIQATLDSIDINTYLPQLVDSLTPVVVEKLYAEIELNKDSFIQTVESEAPVLTGKDAEQLYLDYRTQIINDLVPIILDNIESSMDLGATKEISSVAMVDKPATVTKEPEVIVPEAPVMKTVEPSATVVDEDVAPEATISATVVAQVPSSGSGITTEVNSDEDVIAIPRFYTTPEKELTTEEYKAQRDKLRQDAIAEALSNLSDN